jgi:predicted RNase H-like HicB family nuclease
MSTTENNPANQAGDRIQVPIAIAIHPAEGGGFWAEFPALPKVYAQAETVEELRERATDVVRTHLDRRARHVMVGDAERHASLDAGPPGFYPVRPPYHRISREIAPRDDMGFELPIPEKVRASLEAENRRAGVPTEEEHLRMIIELRKQKYGQADS